MQELIDTLIEARKVARELGSMNARARASKHAGDQIAFMNDLMDMCMIHITQATGQSIPPESYPPHIDK